MNQYFYKSFYLYCDAGQYFALTTDGNEKGYAGLAFINKHYEGQLYSSTCIFIRMGGMLLYGTGSRGNYYRELEQFFTTDDMPLQEVSLPRKFAL